MKKYTLLGITALVLSLGTACEELDVITPRNQEEAAARSSQANEIRKYVIRSGEHHATLSFENTKFDKLKFKALFDSSAIYQTGKPENQGDINKLFGTSDCSSYHHTNSARFGWRWYENQLEIWAYAYVDGERKMSIIDTVALNKFNEYEIRFEESRYVFRLNDKEVEMPRSCQKEAKGYKLFPYFGGDEAAPNDISIWIEELPE